MSSRNADVVILNGHDHTPAALASAPRETPPDLRAFDGGATRSRDWDAYAFHLLPIEGLEVWAKRMQEGASKHGVDNWRGGIPVSENLRHALGHLFAFQSGELRGEVDLVDHIGAAMASLGFIAHFLAIARDRPELVDVPAIRRALIDDGTMEPDR